MDTVITVEGAALEALLHELHNVPANGAYRLRIAVDGGELKVKLDEGMWSPPLGAARIGA